MSIFLLVQNFWESLIPEEELPDLLIMFLRKLLVFWLFYVTKDEFRGCIFCLKEDMNDFDVIVVGGGNAAFCAALAARECGSRVLVLERAPLEVSGGNSRYTAGAFRFAYDDVGHIRELCPELSKEQLDITDFGSYSTDQFFDDMYRLTRFRTDPDLCETLVTQSRETMIWLQKNGIRFREFKDRILITNPSRVDIQGVRHG